MQGGGFNAAFFVGTGLALLLFAARPGVWTKYAANAGVALCALLALYSLLPAQTWPWLTRITTSIATFPGSWACLVLLLVVLAAVRPPQSSKVSPISIAARPNKPRGAHYDARDRQLVRDALRELDSIIWDRVSPAQLTLHKLVHRAYQSVQTGSADRLYGAIDEIVAATEVLKAVHKDLVAKFTHGRDTGEEAWAIIDINYPLTKVTVAADEYVSMLKSIRIESGAPAYDFANQGRNRLDEALVRQLGQR